MLINFLQKCIQWLLAANKSFLCINIWIQKLPTLSIADPQLDSFSVWWITLAYHVPALSAGNSPHISLYTSCWYVQPDFLTFPHPAHSPWFPWPTLSNFQNLDHVHGVCAESYAVGCMIVCRITVVIHPGAFCALTPSAMTRMSWLT